MTPPLFSEFYARLKAERPRTHPIWEHNSKLSGRALAERLGVRVPLLLQTAGDPRDLKEPSWPSVVVKPNDGCSARGVLVLVSDGHGGWLDLFTGRADTWDWWMVHLLGLGTGRYGEGVAGPWLVEERIPGQLSPRCLPYDWKAYVIGGRVEFVAQFSRRAGLGRRGGKDVCQWTRDWRMVTEGARTDYGVVPLPAPSFPNGLITAFEAIAQELPAVFVRVDCYEDAVGPVFGEITPAPGGPQSFKPEWDERLGAAWAAAEARGGA